MKLNVVMSAVLAAVTFVGCVSEHERHARAVAEEARQQENERQAQLVEIEKIKFSCDMAYLVDIAKNCDVMEKRNAALRALVSPPPTRFAMPLTGVPPLPRSVKVSTDPALSGLSYRIHRENGGVTTMSVSAEMAKYGDVCIRILINNFTSTSSPLASRVMWSECTNAVSKALLEIARTGKFADNRMAIVKLADIDTADDGFVSGGDSKDNMRKKGNVRYRQSLLMAALKELAEKDVDANIRVAAAKRISEIEGKNIANSIDVLKLADMAKNNDDSELRLLAMSRLFALRVDSNALKQADVFSNIKVEVDPSMKGLDTISYGSRGTERYIRISAEMAASRNLGVRDRIKRIKEKLAKEQRDKIEDEKKALAEIPRILIDIARNGKHADSRLKAMEGIQDDKVVLQELAEKDTDVKIRETAQKRIAEIAEKERQLEKRLEQKALKREYEEWLASDDGPEAGKEVSIEEFKTKYRTGWRERAERKMVARVAVEAELAQIRKAYADHKKYENPFPCKDNRRSEEDWLKTWTGPRRDLSEEDKLAGDALLSEFGTKYLPNAYANYEKAREAALELQQVFNEEFPEPWAITSTSPKWSAFNKVLEKFAKVRTEYFLCRDELCHCWLAHRLGVLTANDFAKLDSQRLAVHLLPENVELIGFTKLRKESMDGKCSEFAAKYAPESFAIYQKFERESLEIDKLLKDVFRQGAQIDHVRFDRSLSAAVSKRNDLEREMDMLLVAFQAWYTEHRTTVKSSEDVAQSDHATALRLKPFLDSLPMYVKEHALGPVIPKRDMIAIPEKDYRMQRTEVTQLQWIIVMGNNPSRSVRRLDYPVENVSWEDCQQFIKKVNEMDGVKYRLPTGSEWEYACRAGSTGDWGRRINGEEGPLEAMGWYDQNSKRRPHVVASKEPNAWGLYDMHGNVREWCEAQDGDSFPVRRGGSWYDLSSDCTAVSRRDNDPGSRNDFLGFRLATSQDVNR